MPEPIKIQFKPGINRETTDYGNTGGWYDCNLARVKSGTWESVGGWTRFTTDQAEGTFRSLFPFTTLDGGTFYGAGTNLKYYLIRGVSLNDITPLRETVTINNNPFSVSVGDTTVTVTDTAHGAVANDFVTYSGATGPIGGVPAADFNTEHQIVTIIDADSYTIVVATTPSGTATGGGAAVSAAYQINTGLDTTVLGNGWGTGVWGGSPGSVGWGEGSDSSVVTSQLRLWSEDNFGENLLYNVRNGGIYYKDMSGAVSARGVNITTLGDGPSVAMQILVSDNDRHAIAFGCNPVDSATQDRLLARWCDAEDIGEWTPDTTNSAGSLRFDGGSTFMKAVETTTELLIFTDTTLHSMKYIGSPYTFGQVRVGTNVQLIGPNAVVSTGSETFWMANGRFQMYDGVVRDIPCTVRSYIFSILNNAQTEKIMAGINRQFGEVWWHIPVNGGSEVNFYVVFNYAEGYWYYGSFNDEGRTTWLDAWYETMPLAGAPDGYIYLHESGAVDGSVTPTAMLDSYLQSSVFELGNGWDFMYVSRVIPDFDFNGSTAAAPQVTMSFAKRDYPGSDFVDGPSKTIDVTVIGPPGEYTTKRDVRFRTRSTQLTVSTSAAGTLWQMGVPRLFANPDGQR